MENVLDRAYWGRLTEVYETPHFHIHYGLRNPEHGPGLSADGVWDLALIKVYAESLERAYHLLRTSDWRRSRPEQQPIQVYVGNIDAPKTTELSEGGCIELLSKQSLAPASLALNRARAQAAHEVMHVFNLSHRSLRPEVIITTKPWEWLDEALALYAESHVWPEIQDHHRFLPRWIDRPELPLDHSEACYQTWMFLCYLVKRFGLAWVNEVWLEPELEKLPCAVLKERLVAAGAEAATPEHVLETFADYARHAWFLRDPQSRCYAPAVWQEMGKRAIDYGFRLRPAHPTETLDRTLDHLAARYFRFTLADGAQQLTLRVDTESPVLRVGLSVGSETDVCLRTEWLEPGQPVTSSLADHPEARYWLLTVANCGTREQSWRQRRDDQQSFTLAVTAQ